MTVYKLLSENLPKSALQSEHLIKIGVLVSNRAKELCLPIKQIIQFEGKYDFTVNDYPDTFRNEMETIAIKYFQGLK
jgi:hypothetical protein